MKFYFVIACLIWSASALANKGVSGGNGAGGTLLDPQTYEQGVLIDGATLETVIAIERPAIGREFPIFTRLVSELTTGAKFKYWFLDDRALNPDCINPITWKTSQTILACQNRVEVRINKTWWQSASRAEQASLLVHEFLTALRFNDGQFETVPRATSLLLNPLIDANAVADELGRLRFPLFLTRIDIETASERLAPLMARLCVVESHAEHLQADAEFSDHLKLGDGATHRAIQAVLDTQNQLREFRIDGPALCGLSKAATASLIENALIHKALTEDQNQSER